MIIFLYKSNESEGNAMKKLLQFIGMFACLLLFYIFVSPAAAQASSVTSGGAITPQREYIITFNANFGIMNEDNRQTTVNQRLTRIPYASRTGYNFRGWYTQLSGGTPVNLSTVFYTDTILYAQWDINESNFINYMVSDITDTTALLIATIPATYVRTWGVSYGTSTINMPTIRVSDYYASTSTLATPLTGLIPDTTYYYKIYYVSDTNRIESNIGSFTTKRASEYTITFYSNGGILNGSSTITTTGQRLSFLPTAYRDGYNFDGWYTGPYDGTQITAATVFNTNSNVYAHWSAVATINPTVPTTPTTPTTPSPGTNTGTNPGGSTSDSSTSTDVYVPPTNSNDISTNITVKTVKIKSLKNSGKGKAKVKWSWYSTEDGYQISYSTSKKFASGKTKVKNAGIFTESKTITGLKKGKTYYFRVRAYKKENGKKYYGSWSNVKKITIKK